jgi:hypothetical protein
LTLQLKYTINAANFQGNGHPQGMQFDKCQEVWYKTATPDITVEKTSWAAKASADCTVAMIEILYSIQIAIIISILVKLLIIRERLAVGRVPA